MSVRIRDRLLRDHGRFSDAVEFEEKRDAWLTVLEPHLKQALFE